MVITALQCGLQSSFAHHLYYVCWFHTLVAGSLNLTPNDRFLRNFSWQFLFALRVFDKNLPKKYFFHIPFCWRYLTWDVNCGLTSNKITQCYVTKALLKAPYKTTWNNASESVLSPVLRLCLRALVPRCRMKTIGSSHWYFQTLSVVNDHIFDGTSVKLIVIYAVRFTKS